MIMTISVLLSLLLAVIAFVHALWATGSNWPRENAEALVKTVVGAPGRTEMPARWQSAFVALCLLTASIWPFLLMSPQTFTILPTVLIDLGTGALITVFLGRGLVGLTPWFRRLLPTEPFLSLNRTYYSPLCIALGAGFLALLVGR